MLVREPRPHNGSIKPNNSALRMKTKRLRHSTFESVRTRFSATASLIVLIAFLLALLSPPPSSAEPPQRSVLVLYQSITSGLSAYEQISESFRATLNAAGDATIAVYEEHLDLNRFEGTGYLKVIEQYLRDKYSEIPIDVIVTFGSRAFEYGLQLRSGSWSSKPIIFAAVSDSVIDRSKRPPNAAGLTLKSSLAEYVMVARAVVPQLKHVALVGDPLAKQIFRNHFGSELPVATAGLSLIDLTGLPIAEVRKRVSELPERSAILYTTLNVDGDGRVMTPRRALVAIADVANRPIVVDVATHLGLGPVGGFVVIPAEIGQGAANLVLRILRGEDASSIPIEFQPNAVKPVFDWRQLQRFGVSESALPAGSEIRFREPSVWQRYRWQIVAILFAIAFQTVLITWILIEDRYRRRAQAKAVELAAELAHMSRFATVGELSASIAHEIRQPLTAIISAASASLNFLKATEPDLATVRTAQQSIITEGRRADHVIENVRAMLRKEALPREVLNVNSVVQDVLEIVRRKLDVAGITLRTSLAARPEPMIFGDRTQLQQVLFNLVLNAIDAMQEAPERAHELQVRTEIDEKAGVIISIIDSGPGIDMKNIDSVFDPFFTTKPHGMGVGLSISRSIVEAHDGRLTAKRAARYGSIFEIGLPSARQEARNERE